jgi:hypothetical protein
MDDESVTMTVSTPGSEDAVDLPGGVIDLFAEEGEDRATVVADISVFAFAQRIHALAHHDEAPPGVDVEALERATMDVFEERFGATYAEVTGHEH